MNFMGSYPTYRLLDSVLQNKRSVTIYLDIRNNLSGLYYEDSIEYMNTAQGVRDVLHSVLSFIVFVYNYSLTRKMFPKIVIFFDQGESIYHKNISESYKSSRLINKYKTLSIVEVESAFDNIHNALNIMYQIYSKLFNVYIIKLSHLESDFIPYYLISKELIKSDVNIIISNDKDMLQILEFENSFLFSLRGKSKQIYDRTNWYTKFKLDPDLNIDIKHFPFLMSIIGDVSDSIRGIKGIGWKTLSSIVKDIDSSMIDFSDMDTYLSSLKLLIQPNTLSKRNRNAINKIYDNTNILKKNYKLISFKELIKNMSLNQKNTIETQLSIPKLSYKETVNEVRGLFEVIGGQIFNN